jgi:protein O-mannosyl-transferase
MNRKPRVQQRKEVAEASRVTDAMQPVPHAQVWLMLAFFIPNVGALACGFVLDDLPVIVENDALHVRSLSQLLHLWKIGYWPNSSSLALYRPVSETLWAAIWASSGSSPIPFHAVGFLLGLLVVLLVYRFLCLQTSPRTAFIAALLFALFPIHTEATTSVVGSAEVLAAALGLCAMLFYFRDQLALALITFALAVLSKESAAAFAALPFVFRRKDDATRRWLFTLGSSAIIVAVLSVHRFLLGSSAIPPIDNPMALVGFGPRVLTALWVQCLYLFKTILPLTLSADYSYKQIPLVMGVGDPRLWAGLGLTFGALYVMLRHRQFRVPIMTYIVLFSPTANLLFPIGTIMGERLAYVPSMGVALIAAMQLVRSRHWRTAMLGLTLIFGARTAVRNGDWLNADRFYPKLLQTSPQSAKAYYFFGTLRAARGDDVGAIQAYDHAISIFPAYSEAYNNRGNSLSRLGRLNEAMKSYSACLRFNPSNSGAAGFEAGLHHAFLRTDVSKTKAQDCNSAPEIVMS